MHPIEHLRYVARARGVDASTLVEESLAALEYLCRHPNDLLVACRRMVERHPTVAPLWWGCSHVLVAADPRGAARDVVGRLRRDDTASVLASLLPADATVVTVGWPEVVGAAIERRDDIEVLAVDDGSGGFLRRVERTGIRCDPVPFESIVPAVSSADVVLLEAMAVAPGRVLAEPGAHEVAAAASSVGTPVWLVLPLGRRVQRGYLDRMERLVGPGRPDPVAGARAPGVDDVPIGFVTAVVDARGIHVEPARVMAPDCPHAPELLSASPL
ncbi:MAG: hypothetical protein ACO3WU_01675 [Ilumatobacteraceae bacterium]